jgi:hypothetical protein
MPDNRIKPLFPVWPVAAVMPAGKREERKNRPDVKPDRNRGKGDSDHHPDGKQHIDIYA